MERGRRMRPTGYLTMALGVLVIVGGVASLAGAQLPYSLAPVIRHLLARTELALGLAGCFVLALALAMHHRRTGSFRMGQSDALRPAYDIGMALLIVGLLLSLAITLRRP